MNNNFFYYKLIIEYKGTLFHGWQIQKDITTIQGELNRTLSKITKSSDVRSLASGRTDAGVHALGQVCRVIIPIRLEPEALLLAINSLIHNHIKIKQCKEVTAKFHPIRDSIWKEYRYCFTRANLISPAISDLVAPLNFNIDIDLIKSACSMFVGEHDFKNFYCTGSEIETTVKTIFECELIHEMQSGFFSNMILENYIVRVKGSGFLKQMVRLMVGTLFEIGRGKTSLDDLKEALDGNIEGKLGVVAPANGLYLQEVHY